MKVDNSVVGNIHVDHGNWFPFPWKFLADLEVSESKIVWERDKKSIHCLIRNKGKKDSGAFYIRFYTKQKNKSKRFLMQRYVPKLKIGKTFEYDFNIMRIAHHYENNLNDVKEFIIKVDYNNKVEESNEKNNVEIINTSHIPTPPVVDIDKFYFINGDEKYTKINFDLKNLKVIKANEQDGFWSDNEDEPFLWVYGIKIDIESLLTDEYIIKSKNYGHRNVPSLDDGEDANIAPSVGHISFDLTSIPFFKFAILGIVTIALEEDAGPSNNAIKHGYRAGAKKLNNNIKSLKSIKKLKKIIKTININSIGIEAILKDLIQSGVVTSIESSINSNLVRWDIDHFFTDLGYTLGAWVDKDDTIGKFSKFITTKEMPNVKRGISFTKDLKGKGAHYRITGSISVEKPNNYYKTFKHQLQYGDIVLFSGTTPASSLVQIPTNSKWSHIGIVYKEATEVSDVILLESTAEQGVKLTVLGDKIESYNGDISLRHLNVNRTKSMKRALINLYIELKGRRYESPNIQGLAELAKAGQDSLDKRGGHTLNQEDLSKVFCSELVAEAYQRMGLLSSTNPMYPSNEFTPKDFSEDGELDLLKGELLRELLVKD
jgi:hypothetical protein